MFIDMEDKCRGNNLRFWNFCVKRWNLERMQRKVCGRFSWKLCLENICIDRAHHAINPGQKCSRQIHKIEQNWMFYNWFFHSFLAQPSKTVLSAAGMVFTFNSKNFLIFLRSKVFGRLATREATLIVFPFCW